jgi:hypothetical protein
VSTLYFDTVAGGVSEPDVSDTAASVCTRGDGFGGHPPNGGHTDRAWYDVALRDFLQNVIGSNVWNGWKARTARATKRRMKHRSGVRPAVLIPVAVVLAFLVLPKGCAIVFPKGFPNGPRATYEGIVSLPKEGWNYALLTPSDLLEENERLRGSGRQKLSTTCLEASSAAAALANASEQAPPNADGTRDLWVRIEATPRLATGPCMKKFSHSRRHSNVPYGTYLEIDAVVIARPLGCSYLQYAVNHLRCPARESAAE